MPKYNNQFASQAYSEETVLDSKGGVIGTIRLKPSGISWKPLGQHKYYSVTLEAFTNWITATSTGATRTAK
ncbi:MAG: hypothetical protein COZ51_01140 [Candidatus Aquicultor secundus]|nr:MAG: hypothetical protein COZ51_01140 [Candidatus Aquicultor secundus]